MRPIIFTLYALLSLSAVAQAQTPELYVFKDERKEHLKAAKLARQQAREKAVQNDFYMRVRTQTSLSKAKMEIAMKKSYDAEIKVTDMNGTELATVYKGELKEGHHEFYFEQEGDIRKPFVCQLLLDGKTEAMKIVKFNSF